ncbi:ATP-dependent DNA helicase PIF1-like [Trifolium pratense]|uniref:ATP-dependent DNA helicase PIF1-like n=1 Tax=Trifolium pratense TaxID=57577 RepID=UPI001E693CD1|nr:ATP-dependent DNA helicase PIF1-like [Trifolium pratense]
MKKKTIFTQNKETLNFTAIQPNPVESLSALQVPFSSRTSASAAILSLSPPRFYLSPPWFFRFHLPISIDHRILYYVTGEQRDYLSSNSVDMSDVNDLGIYEAITPEFLNSLRTSGLPNHHIKLKIGTPIMLMRNLDQAEGLCNGTRLIITKMADHVIEGKIMSGKHARNVTYIARMTTSPSQSPWPFKLSRTQFPIVVSYAMTINKSQGQSLDSVGLYLPKSVFSHGQLYIALSRVKSKKGLKILINNGNSDEPNSTTNVVFK